MNLSRISPLFFCVSGILSALAGQEAIAQTHDIRSDSITSPVGPQFTGGLDVIGRFYNNGAATETSTRVIAEITRRTGGGDFIEGFEGTFPPAGWYRYNLGGTSQWTQDASAAFSGSYGAALLSETGSDDWLGSPLLSISNGAQVAFRSRVVWGGLSAKLYVLVSATSSTAGAVVVDSFATMGLFPASDSLTTNWKAFTVDLSAYAGQSKHIFFRSGSDHQNYLYLDSVAFTAPVEYVPVASDTQTIPSLAPGNSEDVKFEPLTLTAGYYTVSVRCELRGDEDARNDTLSREVNVSRDSVTLNSPADNANSDPLGTSLSWQALAGAVKYFVQVDDDSNFITPVVSTDTVIAASLALPGLTANVRYYWRVAGDAIGSRSSWSARRSFITATIPTAPVLALPANDSAHAPSDLVFSWNAVSGAEHYRLQVSADTGFAVTVVDDSTLAGTSRAVGPLSASMVYYWRVLARNLAGSGVWSARWRVITHTDLPNAAVFIVPAHDTTITSTAVTLKWNRAHAPRECYVEGFENAAFPPAGWATFTPSGYSGAPWTRTSTTYHNGSFSAVNTVASMVNNQQVLAMPAITISGTSRLSFWARQSGTPDYGFNYIYIMKSSNPFTGISFGTNIYTLSDAAGYPPAQMLYTVWTHYTVDLSPYAGQTIYLGLYHFGGKNIYIDSLVLGTPVVYSNVTGYHVLVSRDAAFSTLEKDTVTADTSYGLSNLSAGDWYVSVAAMNAEGAGPADTVKITCQALDVPATRLSGAALPTCFSLDFTGMTNTDAFIRYGLPVASDVSLSLYNIQGRRIRTFHDGRQAPGYYHVFMDMRALGKGCYVMDFRAGPFSKKKRLFSF